MVTLYCDHLSFQDSQKSHLRHHVEIENEIAESRKNTALAVLQLQHPVVANTNTGEVRITSLKYIGLYLIFLQQLHVGYVLILLTRVENCSSCRPD